MELDSTASQKQKVLYYYYYYGIFFLLYQENVVKFLVWIFGCFQLQLNNGTALHYFSYSTSTPMDYTATEYSCHFIPPIDVTATDRTLQNIDTTANRINTIAIEHYNT